MRHPDNNNNNSSSDDELELERASLARGTGVENSDLGEGHLAERPAILNAFLSVPGDVVQEHRGFIKCYRQIVLSFFGRAEFVNERGVYHHLVRILKDWNQSLSPRGISEERTTSVNICLSNMETSIKLYSIAFAATSRFGPQAIQKKLPHNFNFTLLRIALEEKLNIQIIKQLIDWGCDVNAFDLTLPYDTLLRFAVRYSNESVIQLLVDHGAQIMPPNVKMLKDRHGNTYLHYACMNYSDVNEMISLFLNNQVSGEDCFIANNAGNLPLHLAIQYERPYCFIILDTMSLYYGKYIPSLDKLCDKSVGIHRANNKGHTPLALAVNLYLIRVKYKYKYPARSILLACGLGNSAAEQLSRNIAAMVMRESLQSIRDLVAIGRAGVCYTADPLQESPIDTALRSKNLDLVAALLNEKQPTEHHFLEHWLVANGYGEYVKFLCKIKCYDLTCKDKYNRTSLFYLFSRPFNPMPLLEYLLSRSNLDVINHTDKNGSTALVYILAKVDNLRLSLYPEKCDHVQSVINKAFSDRIAELTHNIENQKGNSINIGST